jgi:hypothetical protein
MEEKKFFDFTGGETFNLDEEYKSLFGENKFKATNPAESKLQDAQNIINELTEKYVELSSLKDYNDSYNNINGFLNKFRTDSDEVKNMAKPDRDKLFGYGKELFTFYQNKYGSLNFNFELSLKEWNYIDHILTKKLMYNGQEIFNFWELYVKFIEPTREIAKQLPKEIGTFIPNCSIQSLVLLSHLLMKHEEKGSTESFYHFKTVLAEIAKMTRLFNAYGVVLERVTNHFNNWVNAINAMDGYNNDDRVDTSEQS